MSHPIPEHWKDLELLIGYLKGKETKAIHIRNPEFLKAFILCDSNFDTNKETRKNINDIVTNFGGTLMTFYSNTPKNITLSIMESEYVALSECAH